MTQRAVAVGDDVTFRLGASYFDGKVVEDRGRVGVNGRRMVRVEFVVDDKTSYVELPARDLDRKGAS